jgi:hypothetical protein
MEEGRRQESFCHDETLTRQDVTGAVFAIAALPV